MTFIKECLNSFNKGFKYGRKKAQEDFEKLRTTNNSTEKELFTILDSDNTHVVRLQINEEEPTLGKIIDFFRQKDTIFYDMKVNENIVELTYADIIAAETFVNALKSP